MWPTQFMSNALRRISFVIARLSGLGRAAFLAHRPINDNPVRSYCRGRRIVAQLPQSLSCPTLSLAVRGDRKERAMPSANYLPDVLETTEAERLATGFVFTEGPLWHPEGYWYFVDIRQNKLFRLTPGKLPELVRANTAGGNGTTFDLQGRLILCEGDGRFVSRMGADGKVETLVDRYKGGRFARPN